MTRYDLTCIIGYLCVRTGASKHNVLITELKPNILRVTSPIHSVCLTFKRLNSNINRGHRSELSLILAPV